MGMGTIGGGKKGIRPEINVTPLVDIVLVLLIIFLVVTPLLAKYFTIQVPPEEKTKAVELPKDEEQLVIRMDQTGHITLNSEAVAAEELDLKLRRVFAARSDSVIFFDAHSSAPYGKAVHVMDVARGAGATTVGIVTEPLVPER